MKKLFTSSYSRASSFPKDAVQVSISRSTPRWWPLAGAKTLSGLQLAPSAKTFQMAKSGKGDWQQAYFKEITLYYQTGNLEAWLNTLPEGAIMLCWEDRATECHRKILADYINGHALADVREFDKGHPCCKP